MISGVLLLQVIGPEWKDALQHLTALTCVWTITRKTGLRVKNVQQLPDFLSMAAGVKEHNEIWVYVDCSICKPDDASSYGIYLVLLMSVRTKV